MKTLVVVLAAAAAALPLAGDALAAEIVREDDQGRTIRLDVRASEVDADWYAGVLRRAAHADEIETVTVRIVERDEVRSWCGRIADGCYRTRGGRAAVVVPAGRDRGVAHTLLHEYAHHVDRSNGHGGLAEPNGTRHWWRTRGMAQLVSLRTVARDYRLGWSRSIAEIFAEDYANTQLETRYAIPWLHPPGGLIRQAILADLGGAAPPTATPRPALRPVVIARRGTLRAGESVSIPFGLLGPGRRVTFSVGVDSGTARIELTCSRRVAARSVEPGQGRVSLDVRNLGPGECRATLIGTGTGSESIPYAATLRLSVGSP